MASPFWTVPNQITFLRLALLPVFLICLFYRHFEWALALLVIAGLSDGLDGLLARRLNQKSDLGMLLDPLADKLLLSSAFVVLALIGVMDWWLTILVLARDVIILAIAVVIILAAGRRTFPPSIYGKVTTVLQILLLFVALASSAFPQAGLANSVHGLVYLVAAATIISGTHYSLTIARRLSSR
jgi:cardiolipin synthase (CMP-forming)